MTEYVMRLEYKGKQMFISRVQIKQLRNFGDFNVALTKNAALLKAGDTSSAQHLFDRAERLTRSGGD